VTAAPPASFPLVPSDEERQIREAVRSICVSFGPDYTRRKTEEGEPPRELWEALAEKGYLGVNIPERYGGGLGMHALQAVGEEISAAGCALLPRRRSAASTRRSRPTAATASRSSTG
jgi:alkylation response protein AidB-like acyl-CoA dehydrogenase